MHMLRTYTYIVKKKNYCMGTLLLSEVQTMQIIPQKYISGYYCAIMQLKGMTLKLLLKPSAQKSHSCAGSVAWI